MKKFLFAALALMIAASPAPAESAKVSQVPQSVTVLPSLPSDVQENIQGIRADCPSSEKNTFGDEGLWIFTVSGAQAVLVDSLNFCGGQDTCFHGINCATGYTHDVSIYVRQKKEWKKSFSVAATAPIFLSTEYNLIPTSKDEFTVPETPEFRALVVSVHGGDEDLGCPDRHKEYGSAWKYEKCDFVVKWDGSNFTHKPL